jgi:hypothetical protein
VSLVAATVPIITVASIDQPPAGAAGRGTVVHMGADIRSAAAQPHRHGSPDRPPPPDVDSVPTFSGTYSAPGFYSYPCCLEPGRPNQTWLYNMVGNPPEQGGTTRIDSPIIPIVVNFRNEDGSVAHTFDPTVEVPRLLQSPLFQNATYSSSPVPTQFNDAIQRAEFASQATADWHTILVPSVKQTRVWDVPYGSWRWKPNKGIGILDEREFLRLLYPATVDLDHTTTIGAAILDGDMTPQSLTTFLTRDVFLEYVNPDEEYIYAGVHSYDIEPGLTSGAKERRYLTNYSTWVPDDVHVGIPDLSVVSHELSEIFNDPFVNSDRVTGVTPWWKSPNGLCLNAMEVADVVDELPGSLTAMPMNGYTYHLENVALRQWFEEDPRSDALGGAFSYPDTTVLTKPAKPQRPGCP